MGKYDRGEGRRLMQGRVARFLLLTAPRRSKPLPRPLPWIFVEGSDTGDLRRLQVCLAPPPVSLPTQPVIVSTLNHTCAGAMQSPTAWLPFPAAADRAPRVWHARALTAGPPPTAPRAASASPAPGRCRIFHRPRCPPQSTRPSPRCGGRPVCATCLPLPRGWLRP